MLKNKNIAVFIIIFIILIISGFFIYKKSADRNINQNQCQVQEITFYYLDGCQWCQKVKDEGTIEKIEQLGIRVEKINAATGLVRHKFEGVPTFVINNEVYSGYKTFEELKELLGSCSLDNKSTDSEQNSEVKGQISSLTTPSVSAQNEKSFLGERGENVSFKDEEIRLDILGFNNNQARFFNVKISDAKTVYFFVLKDRNGIYRAAANACQVCFGERKGFHQEDDEIVCDNCGNRYPIEKIATEKGGCNPGPINPNLEVKDGEVIIKQIDIEQVVDLF